MWSRRPNGNYEKTLDDNSVVLVFKQSTGFGMWNYMVINGDIRRFGITEQIEAKYLMDMIDNGEIEL